MSADTRYDRSANTQFPNYVQRQKFCYPKAFIKRLIARKPMEALQTEIDTDNVLRRTLNWVQLTAIGLGSIIGE